MNWKIRRLHSLTTLKAPIKRYTLASVFIVQSTKIRSRGQFLSTVVDNSEYYIIKKNLLQGITKQNSIEMDDFFKIHLNTHMNGFYDALERLCNETVISQPPPTDGEYT